MSESLQLEPSGENYVLRRTDAGGNVTQIELSEQSILTLARSAPKWKDLVVAKRTRSGADAVSVTEVDKIHLNCDLHEAVIHLILTDRLGGQEIFALSPQHGQALVDHLPRWILQIAQPKSRQ